MAKKVGLVRSKGVTSGRYCGGSESAIPPSEAWKLLNNSIEPARYSRAKVEYRSVRPEIPMSPVKSLRSRLPPQWRAFDLDGRGPRPSSQGERGKEIRKRFWTQSHDRGPREDYRQFPNCCANGEGPRHCHLGARQGRRMGRRRIDRPGRDLRRIWKQIFPEGLASCAPQWADLGVSDRSGNCNSDL